MIYVVMGMDKSGTTLVSQLLHHAGISMVETEQYGISYEQGNHYERLTTRKINYALLQCENIHSLKINLSHPLDITSQLKQQATQIVTQLNKSHEVWGFKDPRTALTYDFWQEILPTHHLIAIYRHPVEVWLHYTKSRPTLFQKLKLLPAVLTYWFVHNQNILKILQKNTYPWLILNFENLLTGEKEFNRLQTFIQKPLIDKRRQSGRHHKQQYVSHWAYRLVAQLWSIQYTRTINSHYQTLSQLSQIQIDS